MNADKRRWIICRRCKRERRHFCKGMCESCYRTLRSNPELLASARAAGLCAGCPMDGRCTGDGCLATAPAGVGGQPQSRANMGTRSYRGKYRGPKKRKSEREIARYYRPAPMPAVMKRGARYVH